MSGGGISLGPQTYIAQNLVAYGPATGTNNTSVLNQPTIAYKYLLMPVRLTA